MFRPPTTTGRDRYHAVSDMLNFRTTDYECLIHGGCASLATLEYVYIRGGPLPSQVLQYERLQLSLPPKTFVICKRSTSATHFRQASLATSTFITHTRLPNKMSSAGKPPSRPATPHPSEHSSNTLAAPKHTDAERIKDKALIEKKRSSNPFTAKAQVQRHEGTSQSAGHAGNTLGAPGPSEKLEPIIEGQEGQSKIQDSRSSNPAAGKQGEPQKPKTVTWAIDTLNIINKPFGLDKTITPDIRVTEGK